MAKKKRSTAKLDKPMYEVFAEALKKGQTTVASQSRGGKLISQSIADAFYTNTIQPYQQQIVDKWFQGWDLAEKPEDYLMDDNVRNIVTLILSGLARANGGQVVIPMTDLGEVGDQIHLDADQRTGLVTITLLPDYVKVGVEPELEVKPKTSYTVGWDPATTTTTTTTNITYKATGPLTVGSGSGASYKLAINGVEQPGTFVNDSANSFEWRK